MNKPEARLPIAVRVWTQRHDEIPRPRKASTYKPPRGYVHTIVFDCETTVDHTQQLNFGTYRIYLDAREEFRGTTCAEEGIFYADDLATRDPQAMAALEDYVEANEADVAAGKDPRLKLLSRSEFVEEVLFSFGYQQGALIVGFNLPFDLTRIATNASPARRWFYGGFSLRLFDRTRFRPNLAYRSIDSKRAFMEFKKHYRSSGARHARAKDQLLDLRSLCFALTDKAGSLESCCRDLDVAYKKRDVVHGVVTADYITYCREDVEATINLMKAALQEFRLHALPLSATKALSPASIGKGYFTSMGITPILDRELEVSDSDIGHAMVAYFGGRAECRVRMNWVPVRYVDFLSMYPTVNALMGTWDYVTAAKITTRDATDNVRALLEHSDLADLFFQPESWKQLLTFVEIKPDGDLLPTRAQYAETTRTFGIGLNPLTADSPLWYSLADLVAAAVLTGKIPQVISAVTYEASGQLSGMRATRLRGEVVVDPRKTDVFKHVIERRRQVQFDNGLTSGSKEKQQRFLKVLANSTGYGIFAEINPQESAEMNIEVLVYDRKPTPFLTEIDTFEAPGTYCFPPLAATITGAARLMLALLQREVEGLGGHYAFCDTDSMAILATLDGRDIPLQGGSLHSEKGVGRAPTLTYSQVDDIVEKFSRLNPYDQTAIPGSILKVEQSQTTPSGAERELWCYAISAKRYTFGVLGEESERSYSSFDLVDPSAHGLGHLLNPYPNESPERWIREAWEYVLSHTESGPWWLDAPALSKFSVSSPTLLSWFKEMNKGKPYESQVKPANFLLIAHPDRMESSPLSPVTPFNRELSEWRDLPWMDRHSGDIIEITTKPRDGSYRPGVVRVSTYRDILNDFSWHPEAKSLGARGGKVSRTTRGLLSVRPVHARPYLHLIGKESNKIEEVDAGVVGTDEVTQVEYFNDEDWRTFVLPQLTLLPRRVLIATAEVSERTLRRYLSGSVIPKGKVRQQLEGLL